MPIFLSVYSTIACTACDAESVIVRIRKYLKKKKKTPNVFYGSRGLQTTRFVRKTGPVQVKRRLSTKSGKKKNKYNTTRNRVAARCLRRHRSPAERENGGGFGRGFSSPWTTPLPEGGMVVPPPSRPDELFFIRAGGYPVTGEVDTTRSPGVRTASLWARDVCRRHCRRRRTVTTRPRGRNQGSCAVGTGESRGT